MVRRIGFLLLLILVTVISLWPAWPGQKQALEAADPPTLRLVVPAGAWDAGLPFDVEVHVENTSDLAAFEFILQYDPALAEPTGITMTEALGDTVCGGGSPRCAVALGGLQLSDERMWFGGYSYGAGPGLDGTAHLATIHMQPKGTIGAFNLHLDEALIVDATAGIVDTPTTADALVSLNLSGSKIYLPLITKQVGAGPDDVAGPAYSNQVPTGQSLMQGGKGPSIVASPLAGRIAPAGIAALPGYNPDVVADQVINIVDIQTVAATLGLGSQDPGWDETLDQNGNQIVDTGDIEIVAGRWHERPTALIRTSPQQSEGHVAVTRETVLWFSRPLDAGTVTSEAITAHFAGELIPYTLRLSPDKSRVTLFYENDLPSSARVRVIVRGNLMKDGYGYAVDAWNQGYYGSHNVIDFDTHSVSPVPGTDLWGYIYDSYHQDNGNDIPVVGATISVDGLPGLTAVTDNDGYFLFEDVPAPVFFVHIDGSTAIAPNGTTYASVGKPFHSVPGQSRQIFMDGIPFDIYLPPVAGTDMVGLSPTQDTDVSFGAAGLLELDDIFPAVDPAVWAATTVVFPAGSAVDEGGAPATTAGIIPVATNRLPAPISPLVPHDLDIAIMAPGATNFDVPAPACFPNIPTAGTGQPLAAGADSALISFNHDAGKWEVVGPMTVSADGLSICTDEGVGILAPGWHGPPQGGNDDSDPPSHGGPPAPDPPWTPDNCKSFCIPSTPPYGPDDGPGPGDDSGPDNQPPDPPSPPDPPEPPEPPDPADPPEEDEGLPENDQPGEPGEVPPELEELIDKLKEQALDKTGADPLGLIDPIVDAAEDALGSLEIIAEVLEAVNNGEDITDEMLEDWAARNEENLEGVGEAFGEMLPQSDVILADTPLDALEAIYEDIKEIADLYDVELPDWPDFPELPPPPDLDQSALQAQSDVHPDILALFDNANEVYRVNEVRQTLWDYFVNYAGDPVWVDLTSEKFAMSLTILQAAEAARQAGTDGGIEITPVELATLVALPRPTGLSEADVNTLVDYWNNTLAQYRQGLVTHAAAGRTDFVDLEQFEAAQQQLLNDLDTEQASGSTYIFQRFNRAMHSLTDDLDGYLRLYYTPGDWELFLLVENWDGSIVQRMKTEPDGSVVGLLVPSQTQLRYAYFDPVTFDVAYNYVYHEQAGRSYNLPLAVFKNPDPLDSDGDYLPDEAEYIVGTLADNPDSDNDGMPDGPEIVLGTNPLDGIPLTAGVVAALDTPGIAVDVCVANNIAAVADGASGVSIIDVSDRNSLITLNQVDTPGSATAVACLGNVLIVADSYGGVTILDISDPPNTYVYRRFSTDEVGGDPIAVTTARELAYVGTASGAVTVIDPWGGLVIDSLSVGAKVHDLAVLGETLFALTDDSVVSMPVFSGPLVVLHSVSSPGGLPPGGLRNRLFVGDGIAYASHKDGYNSIDISQPLTMTLIANGADSSFTFKQIVANGSGLGLSLIGSGPDSNIWLYDISDPQVTNNVITEIGITGQARAVTIDHGLAYVAADTEGLQLVNYLAFDNASISPTLDFSLNDDNGVLQAGALVIAEIAAEDNAQVRDVELYVNGNLWQSDGAFPFQYYFDAPSLGGGDMVTVTMMASDMANNTAVITKTYTLAADSAPPILVSTTPQAGALGVDISTFNIRFNEGISHTLLTLAGMNLTYYGPDGNPGGGDDTVVPLDNLYMATSNSLTIYATAVLSPGNYLLTIDHSIVADLAGNFMTSPIEVPFSSVAGIDPNTAVWIAPGSGNWENPLNWSTGEVPGISGDTLLQNVIIDRPGVPITVTIDGNTPFVGTLQLGNTLELVNRSIWVHDDATVSGRLVLADSGNPNFRVISGTTTVTGEILLLDGTIWADGGDIEFPNLTSYVAANTRDSGFIASQGGTLDLSTLTSLKGGTGNNITLFVTAFAGGIVDLSKIPTLEGGSLDFLAEDPGSFIDLASLTHFTETVSGDSALEVQLGGQINTPLLTHLQNVSLAVRDSSQIQTSQLISLTGGTITAKGSAPDLSNLQALEGTSFIAKAGGTLVTPPAFTTFDNGSQNNLRMEANGAGSLLDLSSLTTLNGGTGFNYLIVLARNGGKVDLSGVPTAEVGSIDFKATNPGSVLDLSNMTKFSDPTGFIGRLQATLGGEIIAPALTWLNDVDATVDGSSTLPTSQLITFTVGILTADGSTPDLAGLQMIDEGNFTAKNGGTLLLPAGLNSYAAGNSKQTNMKAQGAGSSLDFSALTSLEAGTNFQRLNIYAESGGVINLSNLSNITAGAADVKADQSGSQIDLSSLAGWSESGSYGSRIRVLNNGHVALSTGTTVLTDVMVMLNGGTVAVGTLELHGAGELNGAGSIPGNVVNDGLLAPGSSAGGITIGGNYNQTAGGTLEIELGGLVAGSEYDQLVITGSATLTGTLDIKLINAFTPAENDEFTIMTFGSRTGTFNTVLGADIGGGLLLDPLYSPADLLLKAISGP